MNPSHRPVLDKLTPRQRAINFHESGFTWQKSCELAGFDESDETDLATVAWFLMLAGLVILICVGLENTDALVMAFRTFP